MRGNTIFVLFCVLLIMCGCDKNSVTNPDKTDTNPFLENNTLNVENVRYASIDRNSLGYLKIYDDKNLDIQSIKAAYINVNHPFFVETGVYWNLDENQIPVVKYGFGDYYNPVTTTHTALGFYRDYKNYSLPKDSLGFVNNAEWLINNSNEDGYIPYEFDFSHDIHELPAYEWSSAMAQGGALAVMCQAYVFTNDEKYLAAAEKFFRTLYMNTGSLWCIVVDKDGYYWHEEYPNPDFCHVLNGMLYSIWGLWDYYVITDDPFALTLFLAGIRSIADNIDSYNIEGVNSSKYCMHKSDPLEPYHPLHIALLELYLEWFEIPEFREAIEILTSE
ncbi:D-glucuronyl C5-epimerase family protein [Candidatus Latescibacterota bacterium]